MFYPGGDISSEVRMADCAVFTGDLTIQLLLKTLTLNSSILP